MNQDNSQQIEFWNGTTGERWASLTDMTERGLSYATAALMPFAAAKPGEHALDIGCGCGATSLALGRAVGTDGKVVGLDISRPMLAVARQRASGLSNVSFVEADASGYAFSPEYELVFSRFGVMFFADPAAAFANIRGALRPGGRLAFVCWRALSENAWALVPLAAASDLLPPQAPVDRHAPGPFAFADEERLKGILGKAGFRDVRTDKLDTVMGMGALIDDATTTALNMGPLSRAAAEVDDETRTRIRAKVADALRKFETPAGITPPAACWLVSART